MLTTIRCSARPGDSVPHPPVHIAVQHKFEVVTISPNIGNTPPCVHFSGALGSPQDAPLQSSFRQLLPIVAASRSGCVRLTYRIPEQVWHKEGVSSLCVQCSDQTSAAVGTTNGRQRSWGASLPSLPPQRNDEIEMVPANPKPVRSGALRDGASALSGLIVVAPTTWGLATGTNLGYSSIRVA